MTDDLIAADCRGGTEADRVLVPGGYAPAIRRRWAADIGQARCRGREDLHDIPTHFGRDRSASNSEPVGRERTHLRGDRDAPT